MNNSDVSSIDSDDRSRKSKQKSHQDLSVQTGGELLKHYNAVSISWK